jgi:hypothetical protein
MSKSIYITGILLFILVTGCKKETPIHTKSIDTKSNTTAIVNHQDEDFKTFLQKFNKDSLFQISRITFPLKVTENGPDFEIVERTINLNDFSKLDFDPAKDATTREFDRYTQNIRIEKDSAVIEIRGIDNGILSDVIFEKKNGKWRLKTWVDQST